MKLQGNPELKLLDAARISLSSQNGNLFCKNIMWVGVFNALKKNNNKKLDNKGEKVRDLLQLKSFWRAKNLLYF